MKLSKGFYQNNIYMFSEKDTRYFWIKKTKYNVDFTSFISLFHPCDKD